jgi:hypothetical protein
MEVSDGDRNVAHVRGGGRGVACCWEQIRPVDRDLHIVRMAASTRAWLVTDERLVCAEPMPAWAPLRRSNDPTAIRAADQCGH